VSRPFHYDAACSVLLTGRPLGAPFLVIDSMQQNNKATRQTVIVGDGAFARQHHALVGASQTLTHAEFIRR
jgi:hypothetical protein